MSWKLLSALLGLAVLVGVLILVRNSKAGSELTRSKMLEYVGVINSYSKHDKVTGGGSAVYLGDGIWATAIHVISESDDHLLQYGGSNTQIKEIIGHVQLSDIVLFAGPNIGLPPLTLIKPIQDEEVIAVGNALGKGLLTTDGRYWRTEGLKESTNIVTSVPLAGGMSGGAIFSSRGLIGVISSKREEGIKIGNSSGVAVITTLLENPNPTSFTTWQRTLANEYKISNDWDRSTKAIREGDYYLAESLCLKILREFPCSPSVAKRLAYLIFSDEYNESVSKDLQLLPVTLQMASFNGTFDFILGLQYLYIKNSEEAWKHLLKVQSVDEEVLLAKMRLAYDGGYKQNVLNISEYLSDSNYLDTYLLVVASMAEKAKRMQKLQEATRRLSKNTGVWETYATLTLMNGGTTEAIRSYQQALNLSPKNQGMWSRYLKVLQTTYPEGMDQAVRLAGEALPAVDWNLYAKSLEPVATPTPASAPTPVTSKQPAPDVVELDLSTVEAVSADTFVDNYILASMSNATVLAGYWAPHLYYFGKFVTREQAFEESRKYFVRWPILNFQRVSEVQVGKVENGVSLTWSYTFEAKGVKRLSKGLAVIILILDYNSGEVVHISERVIRRY